MTRLTIGGFAAAATLVLLGGTSLQAQSTPARPSTGVASDTGCVQVSRRGRLDSTGINKPGGRIDSTRAGTRPPDTTGINKPGGMIDCSHRAGGPADSNCAGDRYSTTTRPDSMPGRGSKVLPPCGMGAGVGKDSTAWQSRPDSPPPKKP